VQFRPGRPFYWRFMKLIIAGSRTLKPSLRFIDYLVATLIGTTPEHIGEIISGGANGVDSDARSWANIRQIPFKLFEADWNKNGKSAGPIRNKQMAEYGDALLLIWDGKSKGSSNMKENMLKLEKPVYEVILRKL
jgi:hypothetical protein